MYRLGYHSNLGSRVIKRARIDRTMVGDSGHSERSEEVAVMTSRWHLWEID